MPLSIIEWIILGFIFISSVGGTASVWISRQNKKRWNFTYNVLEDAEGSGRLVPTKKGRCRLVSIDISGAEIFYLPALKKYRTAYGRRSGFNHIIWAVDEAGYWHNCYFSGLKKPIEEVGVKIPSAQARYSEASIRKLIKDNYVQKSFMDKYGTIISFGLLFLCIVALGIGQYYALGQQAKISAVNVEAMKINKQVQESTERIMNSTNTLLGRLDIIQSGGTGLRPA